MKLYDFPISPNSLKVRAVAYELGITLEHETVNLFQGESRTPAFLALNPNGRAPVLVDGDFVLWESTAIMRYLVAKNPGSLLAPSTARAQAEVDRWVAWQLAHLGPAMSKVAFERIVKKLTGQGEPDQAAIEAGTAEFEKLTAVLEASLGARANGSDHVAGPLSIADFALGAHYSNASMAGLDVTRHPRVDAWLGRVLARDSMKQALAEGRALLGAHARAS